MNRMANFLVYKGRRILIATTSIISGASLINSMSGGAIGRTDIKEAVAS